MNKVQLLLAVDHRENRRLLNEYLGQYHNIVPLDSDKALEEPFDLGIFDGATLTRLWQQLHQRKEAEKLVFLPILLVTSRQGLSMITRQLWRYIDEIIFTPIEKAELLARTEVLLRARRLSLEVASRNIELRQENIARKEAEDTLRENEERTRLLQTLTSSLAAVVKPVDVSNLIVDEVMPAVGSYMSALTLIAPDGQHLEIVGTRGIDAKTLQRFETMSLDDKLPITEVIRTKTPLWIETKEDYLKWFPELKGTQTEAAVFLPLAVADEVIGAVCICFDVQRRFAEEDRAFFLSLNQQFTQALERARLYDEVREKAALEERQRLARDLHDDISQRLHSISLLGQSLPRLFERNPERAKEILADVVRLAQASTSEMRTLLLELRPTTILQTSLKNLVEQLTNAIQGRRKIPISSIVDFDKTLPEDVHLAIYRIMQEGLNNIVKHSEATEGSISLTEESGKLVLRISDNGRGFETQNHTGGIGLGVMRERAAIIGAELAVNSEQGSGTEIVVTWEIPAD